MSDSTQTIDTTSILVEETCAQAAQTDDLVVYEPTIPTIEEDVSVTNPAPPPPTPPPTIDLIPASITIIEL